MSCIDRAPCSEGDKKQAKDEIDKHWNDAAGPDGLVDEKDMAAAMEADMNGLAQIAKGGKKGGKGGKKGGKKDDDSDSDHPSPEDIMKACDTDQSGGISKQEAHACVDAHLKDADDNAMAHQMIDDEFARVDANGDGEVDMDEGEAEMKKHQGPPPPKE